VSLDDQFGLTDKDVTTPRFLCAPVDKNGEGVIDEETHLVCYEVTSSKSVNLEVEVENLAQLQQAIDAGVDRALLDNFNVADMVNAVELNQKRIELEASGNVELEQLVEIAATGVDFISIGALTKHLRAIDFSLRYR
jgi:nicotinate-nucleotide pyrophosphorylase